MALGPYSFTAHGFGHGDIARSLDAGWAENAVIGALNALQWTGPKSESMTIKGVLFPIEWGGMATLEALRAEARAGAPLMLVSLGGMVFGRHAIQRIEEDRSFHNRHGTPGKLAWTMELRRLSGAVNIGSLAENF